MVKVEFATTTLVDWTRADGGMDTVIVSSADRVYEANAGKVIVTTVALVRSTALDVKPARTTAFHPVDSDWADVSPAIKNVVIALSAPTVASHVSSVRVRMMVEPPLTICASSSSVTVPVSCALAV